eukprot:scaffold248590_cov62-Cyclotella_meneghiniana.AAC.3
MKNTPIFNCLNGLDRWYPWKMARYVVVFKPTVVILRIMNWEEKRRGHMNITMMKWDMLWTPM